MVWWQVGLPTVLVVVPFLCRAACGRLRQRARPALLNAALHRGHPVDVVAAAVAIVTALCPVLHCLRYLRPVLVPTYWIVRRLATVWSTQSLTPVLKTSKSLWLE